MITGLISTMSIRFSQNYRVAGSVMVGESAIYLHGTPEEVRAFASAVMTEADDMENRVAHLVATESGT